MGVTRRWDGGRVVVDIWLPENIWKLSEIHSEVRMRMWKLDGERMQTLIDLSGICRDLCFVAMVFCISHSVTVGRTV